MMYPPRSPVAGSWHAVFRLAALVASGLAAIAALLAAPRPAHAAQVTVVSSPGDAAVSGAGFRAGARGAVLLGGTRLKRLRVDRAGRFSLAVTLPRPAGRGNARRLVVRAGRRRIALPLAATAPGRAPASVTVGPGSRAVLLRPYSAAAGAPRTARGWRWPAGARVSALVAGRALETAEVDARGRFTMRPSPSSDPGSGELAVRAGGLRIAVPFRVTPSPVPNADPRPPGAPGAPPGSVPGTTPATPPPTVGAVPPPPPPPAPVIAAAGDIACAPGSPVTATACRQAAVSNLLVGTGLSAVLPLGDNQYENGTLAEFRASYGPTWGRVNSIVYPVLGNREYGAGNAAGYFAYFGARAGSAPGGYYSYDIGAWHLTALNSNCGFVACGAGSAQETWLRGDLAAHSGGCQIAYWHHPLFNSGTVGRANDMTRIWQDLHAAGVDIVLSGHDHHYERFAPQNAGGVADASGPRQFIVGTGGASHASRPTAVARNSQVRNYDTYGVLRLTLRGEGYDWHFVPEAGRRFTDGGTEACR